MELFLLVQVQIIYQLKGHSLSKWKSNHFWNVDSYNFLVEEGDEMGRQLVERVGHKLWYFNLYNNKELEDTIIGNNKETIA